MFGNIVLGVDYEVLTKFILFCKFKHFHSPNSKNTIRLMARKPCHKAYFFEFYHLRDNEWWTRGESFLLFARCLGFNFLQHLAKSFGHRSQNNSPGCFVHCVRLPFKMLRKIIKGALAYAFLLFWWTRGESNPCPKTS